ncbi:MAG TPA: hypothetical protein ENH26_03035 [Candidatus Wolfebacteria bacterium]|nr:hypothetical protein [Candidatus Wolfebacteria bacterium]
MPKPYKLTIAIISSLLILTAMYYGSFLPFRKSQLYINAQIGLSRGVSSLQEFNNLFEPALDFYSPVGQDEIVSGYLRVLISLLEQQSNKEIVDILTKQAETRMAPILEKEKGFGLSQNIYNLASIYAISAIRFNDDIYYEKGVEMFKLGLKHSPNRAMFLYGLLNLYQFKNNKKGIREVGEIILKYWPGDEQVKQIIKLTK